MEKVGINKKKNLFGCLTSIGNMLLFDVPDCCNFIYLERLFLSLSYFDRRPCSALDLFFFWFQTVEQRCRAVEPRSNSETLCTVTIQNEFLFL